MVGPGKVLLGDVAELYCVSRRLMEKCMEIPLLEVKEGKYGRYLVSVRDVIKAIGSRFPGVEVVPLGDPEMVLEYAKRSKSHVWLKYIKTAVVSLIVFVGSAFTIMTFLAEANVPGLLARVRECFEVKEIVGQTGMEICFSLGVGFGMIFYFNHFGRWRLQQEPTPMEMELHQYMEDVEETVLELEDGMQEGGD
ncbi:MAG TPA: hypothetical protein DF613_04895 [Lachnospiraceae bacterium]|nr:hypothetical protein [Lachnospiraceae bacterium]